MITPVFVTFSESFLRLFAQIFGRCGNAWRRFESILEKKDWVSRRYYNLGHLGHRGESPLATEASSLAHPRCICSGNEAHAAPNDVSICSTKFRDVSGSMGFALAES